MSSPCSPDCQATTNSTVAASTEKCAKLLRRLSIRHVAPGRVEIEHTYGMLNGLVRLHVLNDRTHPKVVSNWTFFLVTLSPNWRSAAEQSLDADVSRSTQQGLRVTVTTPEDEADAVGWIRAWYCTPRILVGMRPISQCPRQDNWS